MIENNQILNVLNKSYEQKRFNAQNKAYEINASLNAHEDWTENRYKIKNLSLSIAKAQFEENFEKARELEKERELLLKERASLLKKYNFTESDLQPQYTCKKCNDSGYDQTGKPCECFSKNLALVCKKILNLPTLNLPNFSDFKQDTQESAKLKLLLTDYVDKFPPKTVKNLLFTGASGVGKTFSAGCIANALEGKNYNVIYLSGIKLNEIFLTYHTASISDKQAIFSLLTTCDLLVIDDLGTEPLLANVTAPYLTAVISERLNQSAPFIITTNLNFDEMKTRYTERFSSRLSGKETARIAFTGKDLRVKK